MSFTLVLCTLEKHIIYMCHGQYQNAHILHILFAVTKYMSCARYLCNAKNMQCSPKIHVVFAGPMQANVHLTYTSYANQDACNVDVSHVVQSRCNIPMPCALYRSVQFIWSLCSPNMHTTYVWPIRSWDACDLHVVHAIPCSLKMCIFFVFPMTS